MLRRAFAGGGWRAVAPPAFQYRNFRIYWGGLMVCITGWQMQLVTQGWLVYQMTDSPFLLGAIGLVQALPIVLLSMVGGVVADRVDRRRLMMFTQGSVASLLLLEGFLLGIGRAELWHIFAINVVIGVLWSFDQPSRVSLLPNLIGREALMSALALGSTIWQSTRIVGPALAGVLIATVGMAPSFYVMGFAMLSMIFTLKALDLPPSAERPAQKQNPLQNLIEGLRYIFHEPIFGTLFAMTFFNSTFGMAFVTLMPVMARDTLGVGSQGFGVLISSTGGGALLGVIIAANLGGFRHRGKLMLGMGALFGLFVMALALVRSFELAVVVLFLICASNQLYMVLVNTSLQALVPDQLRGRVMGTYSLTWSLTPLGGAFSGLMASQFDSPALGASVAIAFGGLMVVAFSAYAAFTMPRVRAL